MAENAVQSTLQGTYWAVGRHHLFLIVHLKMVFFLFVFATFVHIFQKQMYHLSVI